MIHIPKPPKQPSMKSPLHVWGQYLSRMTDWVHVLKEVHSYSLHKHAVKKMGLKELDSDGEWKAPKFKVKKRTRGLPPER